jgi:hypothetical protein
MSKKTEGRESYIVQNVTPGYHYISDMKLNIGPLEVIDLSYRDADEVRGSQNLRDSLRAGYIRKITPEESERIATKKTAQLRKGVSSLQQQSRRDQIEVEGKTLDVEPLNLSRTESSKMSEQVSSAGYANDPLSYAVALEIAQSQAEASGDTLLVEEFAEMVSRDSDLVRRLITSNTNSIKPLANDGLDSGAFYAEPPVNEGEKTVVSRKKMTAPPTMKSSVGADDFGNAEQIDLTKEN